MACYDSEKACRPSQKTRDCPRIWALVLESRLRYRIHPRLFGPGEALAAAAGSFRGSITCKQCLMEIPNIGCITGTSRCQAKQTCLTAIVSQGRSKNGKFLVFGCVVPNSITCGMTRRVKDGIVRVRCCSRGHLCNRKYK